jgi:hypothetical protein
MFALQTGFDRVDERTAKGWTGISKYSDGGEERFSILLVEIICPDVTTRMEFDRPGALCHR